MTTEKKKGVSPKEVVGRVHGDRGRRSDKGGGKPFPASCRHASQQVGRLRAVPLREDRLGKRSQARGTLRRERRSSQTFTSSKKGSRFGSSGLVQRSEGNSRRARTIGRIYFGSDFVRKSIAMVENVEGEAAPEES